MTAAFVDTSVLLAIAFREPDFEAVAERLSGFETVYACELLEAELRSAYRRENMALESAVLDKLTVIQQLQPLREEMIRVLAAGYLRGADCFHVAMAMSLAPDPRELTFLTLDKRQREVAAALGFAV